MYNRKRETGSHIGSNVAPKRIKTTSYKSIAKKAMTRMKIISTPRKTNQPNPNENKQTSSHVGKLLASSGIKNGGNIYEIFVIWH